MQTRPSQFSLFLKLPAELQYRIWDIASSEPRVIPGYCPDFKYFIPPLLQVSHDSRQAALRPYRPVIILQCIENQMEASLKAIQQLHDTQLSKFPDSLDWFPNHVETIFAFYHSIHDSFLGGKKWDEAEGFARWIGVLYESSERIDEVIAMWTRLLDHCCQEGLLDRAMRYARLISNLYKSSGRADEAIAMWKRVLDLCRQEGLFDRAEGCARWISSLYKSSGRVDEAIAMWTHLLGFYSQKGLFNRAELCARWISSLSRKG